MEKRILALPPSSIYGDHFKATEHINRLFREWDKKREDNSAYVRQTEIEKKAKDLKQQLNAWQKRYDNLLAEEMKPLILLANATAWKRTNEMREKIVSLETQNILASEKTIISEYVEFFSRPDIGRIKEQYPEVAALKTEPTTLLRMAWERLESKQYKKLTPDEWREKEANKILFKAQDEAAAKRGALQAEITSKLDEIKLRQETDRQIDETPGLTEEEKEEIKSHTRQVIEILRNKDSERPQEMI